MIEFNTEDGESVVRFIGGNNLPKKRVNKSGQLSSVTLDT